MERQRGGIDADTQPLFGMLLLPEISALIEALGDATSAEWIEDTSLAGESVHHLRFSPQLDGLHPCLLFDRTSFHSRALPCTQGVLGVEGEAWLSAENLTPSPSCIGRVTHEGLDDGTHYYIDHTLQLADINTPVQINPP